MKCYNRKITALVIFLASTLSFLFFAKTVNSIESGWYTNDPSAEHRNNLATYASQGATVMLPYNCYFNEVGTTAYLNEAAARGIKVWVDLRLHALGGSLPSETAWKNFISSFKNHPAVKGWYIADEPEYSGPSYSVIQQYYNWTKQADPAHPVSIAHAWRVPSGSAGMAEDILLDVYPQWGYGNTDYNEFCWRVRESYDWWRQAKSITDGRGQSIWAVPLGFGYSPGTTNPQNSVRDLTDAEHRWHTYTALVLGYKGAIFWWDMNNPSWTQTNPHMKSLVTKRFSEISQMAKEMDNATTNSGLASVSVPTSKLIYRYGTDPAVNTGVILAVNISRYSASDNNGETLSNVQFTLPAGIRPLQVTVVGENRNIPVNNGVFSDSFNRFDVHIYKFTASGSNSTPAEAELKFGWWVNVSTGQGRLASYAANGMNFGHINVATYYTTDQINAFLNEAHALGIEMSISLNRTEHCPYPWSADQVQSFVNTIKNNPGLWGWYIADEPELGSSNVYTYLKSNPGYYPAVKSADPAHPRWIVFSGSIHSGWNDVTDIVAVDLYPSYGTAEFENSQLRYSYDTWKAGNDYAIANNKSPFIAVVQGFGLGHGLWDDMSLAEEKYHVLTAVVAGVQRILFWMEEWADMDTNRTHTYNIVGEVMRYIRDIKKEMANGITNDPSIGVNQDLVSQNKLVFRHGASGSSHVILAVNIANRGNVNGQALSNVQFTLPSGVRSTQVEVLSENRALPVTNGVFTDNFNRFEVHAYKFIAGTTPSPTPSPSPSPNPADVNRDGKVDASDMSLVLGQWGSSTPGISEDVNHDGKVNFFDMVVVIANWNV